MKTLILFISCFFLLQLTFAQNTFGPEHNITYNPGNVDRVFYFDVDGDDISDLVTFGINDGELFWYKNFGGGDFVAAQYLLDINTEILYTSDIDNDNDIDFVFQSNNENVGWYSNDGSGNYSYEGTLLASGDPFADFLLGDIDGDSDDDIVLVFSPIYPTMMWYSNLGSGYFSTPNMIASSWEEYSGYLKQRLTDIDNDGDLDVLCKKVSSPDPFEENYYLKLFKNNGNSFSSHTIFTDYYQVPHAVDINGDGFQELISNDDDYESVWFENNGNNEFINQFDLTSYLELDNVISFDAEFDGDFDIFHASGQTKWSENKNDGTFEDDYVMSYNGGIILNGDIDLDNDDDVIIANSGSISWVENTTFTTNLSENKFVDIKIFPNPATKEIVIETDLSVIRIEIINNTGQIVKTSNLNEIDVSDLESDVYFVKIINKNGHIVKFEKLVVLH